MMNSPDRWSEMNRFILQEAHAERKALALLRGTHFSHCFREISIIMALNESTREWAKTVGYILKHHTSDHKEDLSTQIQHLFETISMKHYQVIESRSTLPRHPLLPLPPGSDHVLPFLIKKKVLWTNRNTFSI